MASKRKEENVMHVQIINFKLKGVGEDDYRKLRALADSIPQGAT